MRSRLRAARLALRTATIAMVILATMRLARGPASQTPVAAAERLLKSIDPSAAGVEESRAPAFVDVTEEVGLHFVHDDDAHGRFLLPEIVGPGAGFLDYDGDGDLDVFVGGGGSILGDGPPQSSALFRNDDGRFTEVTREARAGVLGPAYGVACADIEGDGDTDVFVSRLGGNALLLNDGAGGFDEVAAAAGVRDGGFATSAAFFDYDLDGQLDLYVCRYVDWNPALEEPCVSAAGLRDYCAPKTYDRPSTHRLFHNIGGGRFADVTHAAGIDRGRGNGLGVAELDFDGDGRPDLYVANDMTPAFLWHNRGDGTFVDEAPVRGAAYDGQGVAISGMGVAAEDLDADGDEDLLVTNIRDQTHLALRNDRGSFLDVSASYGLPRLSLPRTGFGVVVFDQDQDGEPEVLVANGAVSFTAATARLSNPYAEHQQLLRLVSGRFVDRSSGSGADFLDVGRAVAAGDYDGDGDVDLLITSAGGPVRLLRNTADRENPQNAWLIVDVRTALGRASAIGARVEVSAGARTWCRRIRSQASYLATSDPRAHFGLGPVDRVDRVVVTWPDGSTRVEHDVAPRQVLVLRPEVGGTGG